MPGSFATTYMTPEGKALKGQYQWEARAQWKGTSRTNSELVSRSRAILLLRSRSTSAPSAGPTSTTQQAQFGRAHGHRVPGRQPDSEAHDSPGLRQGYPRIEIAVSAA